MEKKSLMTKAMQESLNDYFTFTLEGKNINCMTGEINLDRNSSFKSYVTNNRNDIPLHIILNKDNPSAEFNDTNKLYHYPLNAAMGELRQSSWSHLWNDAEDQNGNIFYEVNKYMKPVGKNWRTYCSLSYYMREYPDGAQYAFTIAPAIIYVRDKIKFLITMKYNKIADFLSNCYAPWDGNPFTYWLDSSVVKQKTSVDQYLYNTIYEYAHNVLKGKPVRFEVTDLNSRFRFVQDACHYPLSTAELNRRIQKLI